MKVLDHGSLTIIETWGSDERIIEAARMSTNKGFLGWGLQGYTCPVHGQMGAEPARESGACCEAARRIDGDEKLLRFLYENKHHTPFEMAGMTIEIQAPIFVFREWHRHRTQSYNEMSARYTPLPDVNYLPSVERLMINSATNKQAGRIAGADYLTTERARFFQECLRDQYRRAEILYQEALSFGVPKELARVHLPVGRYSRMRASANLRNWIGFLTLRAAPAAQWEIRQYAIALSGLIAEAFPRTHALYAESA